MNGMNSRLVATAWGLVSMVLLGLPSHRGYAGESPAAAPLRPGELRMVRRADTQGANGINLVPNPSFEVIDGDRPKGWIWDARNTDATFAVVDDAHTGRHAIRLTNGTATSPHVYGQVVLLGGLTLQPGKVYTLSLYCKSEDPGVAWAGGGDGWWMRLPLRGTGGAWKQFTKTFVARNGDRRFPLMVNTDGPTKGFLVDDIKVELGAQATPLIGRENGGHACRILLPFPDEISVPGSTVEFPAVVYRPPGVPNPPPARVVLTGRDGTVEGRAECSEPLRDGMNVFAIRWALPKRIVLGGHLRLTVGDVSTERSFSLTTPAQFYLLSRKVAAEAAKLERLILSAEQRGLSVPYARAAAVIWRRFGGIAERKVKLGKTVDGLKDMEFLDELCRSQGKRLEGILAGKIAPRSVPDPSLADLRLDAGEFRVGDSPVMLVGALGYGELRREIGTYGEYGFNVIGDDFNSYSAFRMLTGKDSVDETVLPRLKKSWRTLADKNLVVAYNPTLHYFPEWALKMYPDITGGEPVDCLPDWSGLGRHAGKRTKVYGGFFPFAIDSPSLRRLVSRYYAALFPRIRDLPPFRVTWLMNEPTYKSTDAHYVALYRKSLRRTYGSIGKLNSVWGTAFADFEEVPPAPGLGQPGRYDWLVFHRDQVASWFAWLAARIKEHDPKAVLSNKPMAWTFLHPELGIDFEREALLWEVPGCDASRHPGSSTYAFGWRTAAMLFDFQTSVAPGKPLADLEYHYVHQPGVSSDYVRATYFQSYLHGLRLSQFWVWATGELGDAKTGAGMRNTAWSQPRVAWGTATSALDLRRLAPIVSLFPPPAEVALYLSRASLYVDTQKHRDALIKAYVAAMFVDAPVGFVTDRMIRAGALKRTKLLVLPQVDVIEPDLRREVSRFAANGGHVLALGPVMTRDPHGRTYPKPIAGKHLQRVKTWSRRDFDVALTAAGVTRQARALTVDGTIPAEPIEVRSVQQGNRRLVSILGMAKHTVSVRLLWEGHPVESWYDLIHDKEGRGPSFEVAPLSVRLLEIR